MLSSTDPKSYLFNPDEKCPFCPHIAREHNFTKCTGRIRTESKEYANIWRIKYERCVCDLSKEEVKLNIEKRRNRK